ncbi:MAG: hypothetical protein ABI674_04285 [Spartobacteria bacterium]
MKRFTIPALPLAVLALTSCGTMHDAAVSTFRVVDAPHQYVRRQLGVNEQPQETTTTTTTEVYSDSSYPPSQPYAVQQQQQPPPPPVQTQRRVVATEQQQPPPPPEPRPTATPRVTTRESAPPTTTSTQRTASSTGGSDLPYAKPVPGKPGYVFSPFDKNGGYVDVTGYTPGQKVKDPYSGKIFLVP